MLNLKCKLSIVHTSYSDHGISYASVNTNKKLSSTTYSAKAKLDLGEAIKMVERLCANNLVSSGNELNVALEKIVNDCTATLTIKSSHSIFRPHINRELVLAVRERYRLYMLATLYIHNNHLLRLYHAMKLFVKMSNEKLRSEYECNRIVCAAGNDRKTWKLDKEITINGDPVNDSIDSGNKINNHFCSAGEVLATNIISIHGYETDDIDNLYTQYANNNLEFNVVDAKGRLKLIHKSGSMDIENFRGLTLLHSLSMVFESDKNP